MASVDYDRIASTQRACAGTPESFRNLWPKAFVETFLSCPSTRCSACSAWTCTNCVEKKTLKLCITTACAYHEGRSHKTRGLALQTSPIGITSAREIALPFRPHSLLLQAHPSSILIMVPVPHLHKVSPHHFTSTMAHDAFSLVRSAVLTPTKLPS